MPEISPQPKKQPDDQQLVADQIRQRLKAAKEGGEGVGTFVDVPHLKKEQPWSEEAIKTPEQSHEMSRLVQVGDPVLPYSIENELEADGSWFLGLVLEDDDKNDIEIFYKTPDDLVQGHDPVTWEKITPRYETAAEYVHTLEKIREAHKQAGDEGDETYQKNLQKLYRQVHHFAQDFHDRWSEKMSENS